MDLRRLGLFLAVVDEGGFTAAARSVHVAQPAISLAVRELETELGARLLVRTRNGVHLTPAGEALVGPARRALREVDTAAAAVAAVAGLVAGRLDVASLASLAADPLATMVGRFRQAHDPVTVRLTGPDDPGALAEAVRTGSAELGVTQGGRQNAGLEEVRILDQQFVAVSPPGSPGAGRVLDLRRIAGLPLVVTPPGTSLRAVLDRALAEAGVEPVIAVETTQRDSLIPLALAGAGTTFVPSALADLPSASGAVVRRTRPTLTRQVVIVHRPSDLSPAARRFIEIALG